MNEVEERMRFTKGFKRLLLFIPVAILALFVYDVIFDGINR